MQWLNEPPQWSREGETLSMGVAGKTDFWRKTNNDGIRDNGHFYYEAVTGDFVAEVVVRGEYATLYDQAGLMARTDEANWLKCGIEYVEGVQYVSAVVTRDYSDWSVRPLAYPPMALWLRLSRVGETLKVHYALDGVNYSMLREAYLPMGEAVQVGMMAAAPQGEGFAAWFDTYRVE